MEALYITLFMCYASYAFNRKSVGLALPSMMKGGLDISDAGLILSCWSLAFAGSKFLAGVLSDRMNPQTLFASGLIVSGAAATCFSTSSSVTAFCSYWIINGLAQGCGWPSCAKILRQKASPSQFGTLWTVLSSAQNISGALSPIISAYIILNYSWQWSVFTPGIISVLLGIFSFVLLKPALDTPSKSSPKVENLTEKHQEFGSKTTIYDLLKDPFLGLVSACFMLALCAKTTLVDWGQVYLMDELKRSPYEGYQCKGILPYLNYRGWCPTHFVSLKSLTILFWNRFQNTGTVTRRPTKMRPPVRTP